MSRKRIAILLFFFIIIGLSLRILAYRNLYLWQDEAETTINSLQVLEKGYPFDTFKGKPIFENASFIPSDHEKYAYESTNYYNSPFERNKGWLTYYYQASFLKLLGFSTFNARLPFVLLFPFSLALLYLLAKRLFTDKVALLAAFFYSINYFSIFYERQARYYSLLVLLSLFCLFFFYQALTLKKWRYYLWSALGILLMFYTHIIASICLGVFFILVHIYYYKNLKSLLSPKLITSLILPVVLALPWLIVVKFWEVLQIIDANQGKIFWLLILLILSLFIILNYFFLKVIFRIPLPNWKSFSAVNYLLLYIVLIFALKPFLIPSESIHARLFIEVNTLLMILFPLLLLKVFDYRRHDKKQKISIIANCFVLLVVFLIINLDSLDQRPIDTVWVEKSIAYLAAKNVSLETPIFVSYQQLPFMLYSNYNVDLIWPIRKSYLDNYKEKMYIILNGKEISPKGFYRDYYFPLEDLNFYKKIQSCPVTEIYTEAFVYECN